MLQSTEEPLGAANVGRCQQQAPSLLSLVSLLAFLLLLPPPPRLRLSLLRGVTHKPCYAPRWRNFQPNPNWETVHSTQIWGSPFVLMPMWVSGSQPSSCWQIIKNAEAGWTFALRLYENKPWVPCPCSKVDTDATKREKKIPPEPCQYILIFCLAEKHRLDTPSHCLENNFTPLQSDIQTHAPHRLRHGNWSLKGDFRQMGGYYHKGKT